MEQAMNDDKPAGAASELDSLLPCPFCGGPVKLESAGVRRDPILGSRKFWGVVCRNTANIGGSCCMEQVPSASKKAAVDRWNMRNGVRYSAQHEGPGAALSRTVPLDAVVGRQTDEKGHEHG